MALERPRDSVVSAISVTRVRAGAGEPSEPDVPRMLAVIDEFGAEIIGPPMDASD